MVHTNSIKNDLSKILEKRPGNNTDIAINAMANGSKTGFMVSLMFAFNKKIRVDKAECCLDLHVFLLVMPMVTYTETSIIEPL